MPSAIVFDMDGVILDSERLDRQFWHSVAATYGLEFPDALHDRMIGVHEFDTVDLLRAHFGNDFAGAMRARDAMWRTLLSHGGVPHKNGARALLTFLEAVGIPKAIATSTERDRALQFLGGLARRFEALACGDEVALRKPAPDVYLLAASRLKLDPRECVALEDSPVGYAAAGMMPILIPDLLLPATPPRYSCNSLQDILEWLRPALA
jgi:beta-phosphoglucomutase-like phosphatase (HAD superfamily)